MNKFLLAICLLPLSYTSIGQELTGSQLLERTIAYHDPNGAWETFDGTFLVTMETPKSANRDSEIHINLKEEYFQVTATRDTVTTSYTLSKDDCTIRLNGKTDLSESTLKEHNLSCERGRLYKDYYTYLYGLPMKLKDPGTNINPIVELINFKGKDYLVLEATYDEGVGKDVWYFYFDPNTYAMEIYQFFKGDPEGEGKDTGEYILLSEEAIVQGIKMPKIRAWYYNKDHEYLGTDILK
ncbi:MAG: hypothetical protein Aureis2KO_26770 [Aureisphaera sp.]